MRTLLRYLCFALSLLGGAAYALTPAQTLAIAAGDNDSRIAALNAAAAGGDARLAAFVQALLDGEVKVAGDKVYLVQGDKATIAATGEPATVPDDAEDVTNNNRMRGALDAVLSTLRLFSPDLAVRRAAIVDLGKATLEEGQLPLIDKALAAETDPQLKDNLGRMRAAILISSSDRASRLAAARELGSSSQSTVASLLSGAARRRRRGRSGSARGAAAGARRGARPSRLGRAARRDLHRPVARLGAAAGRARPGHHLRPDGRHQHGARRADDDRRLHHLRRAEPVPRLCAGRVRRLHPGGDPGRLPGRGAGRRGARARRHPLPLRPAARDAARHLGHQPGAAAGGALDLRRAERAGREPDAGSPAGCRR